MTRTTLLARGSGLAVILTALLGLSAAARAQQAPAAPATVGADNIVQGYTSKPYALFRPAMTQFGIVLERPAKVGQAVKKGEVLLRQDDRQERALLAELELEANSAVRVELAEADLKLKAAQYKREQELLKTNSTNPMAVEEAQSKWLYADAQLKIAKLELAKAKLKVDQQRVKLEQMTLRSPVDGYVEQIDVEVGDVTDPQKPVMTIVQNDPLKVGQELQVRYPGETQWISAKIAYKSPVAETASDTQKIGLVMENAQQRDAGLQVQVKLPDDVVASR